MASESTFPAATRDRRWGGGLRADHSARCAIRGDRLFVTGDIDNVSSPTVRAGIIDALHDSNVRVIDLTGVTFFAAAGVRLLEEFELQRRYAVLGTPHMQRVLDVVACGHLLGGQPRSATASRRLRSA